MKIYTDGIRDFKAWSGAVDTWDAIREHDKIEMLESVLDEIYTDGISESELNDFLWFDPETICEWVGLQYDEDTGEITA